jgi:uncharacterized BrkB/YihY/UPF0761 family membrane protein
VGAKGIDGNLQATVTDPWGNGKEEGNDMGRVKMIMVIPMFGLLLPLFFIIGTVISMGLQEGMDMRTTVLVIITMLGFTIPLLWLVGTLAAMVYFYLRRASATGEERTVALHPQLGVTMADGGDSIEKKEKG